MKFAISITTSSSPSAAKPSSVVPVQKGRIKKLTANADVLSPRETKITQNIQTYSPSSGDFRKENQNNAIDATDKATFNVYSARCSSVRHAILKFMPLWVFLSIAGRK